LQRENFELKLKNIEEQQKILDRNNDNDIRQYKELENEKLQISREYELQRFELIKRDTEFRLNLSKISAESEKEAADKYFAREIA